MIKEIQRLSSQLQLEAFVEANGPEEAHVDIENSRTIKIVPASRSKSRSCFGYPGTVSSTGDAADVHTLHRVVKPWPTRRAALCCGTNTAENRDGRLVLIGYLSTTRRQQVGSRSL